MAETIDNALLVSLLRDTRREQTGQRTLLLSAIDDLRKMEQRLDARITATRDDLELVLKSELMGSPTHFGTRIDQRLADLESQRR